MSTTAPLNASNGQGVPDGISVHDTKAQPAHQTSLEPAPLPPPPIGIPQTFADTKNNQEREVTMEEKGGAPVIPTIVIQDSEDGQKEVKARDTPQTAQTVQDEEAAAAPPGGLPTSVVSDVPDWYMTGWRQVTGIDNPPLPEGVEKDKRILEQFISEQFYGAWYHNAAVIIFAVLASHFLTRFNFGWGWLFIILAICNTYYSTSMERVRRNARDDIQRELVKTRLASEHESAEWINNFLDRFWLMYEPVLSMTIKSSVNQILSTAAPAFLDSLKLEEFTLGTKAPRIDQVRTFPKTEDDIVMMDWGLSFTPMDVSDMTRKQIANKTNPKVVLHIRVGKGLATAALPVLVEDITFSGLMRIRMKLMSNFPHVQVVDICFLEKPTIDYVLKPLGGETFGIDIANIPGLSSFIRDMTHATLGPMMYDPNVFTLNLEQLLSGKPLDAAIGVVQVIVRSARGIKGTKIGGGTPDPYVSLSINNRAELARTKYKTNTYNPTWMETHNILINNINENLVLSLYDYNDHRKNTLLSSASFEMSKLLEDATQEDLAVELLKDGKERGELRFDVNYFPVVEPVEGQEEVLESTVGIVRLTIHQAKELDSNKSMSGELNPFAKVYINGSRKAGYATPRYKHTNNPVWEAPYEYLCTDKENATVTIKIIDDRDFLKDPVVGYMAIKLTDLLEAKGQAGRDWFPLSGCKSGKLRLSADWKPLAMAGALHGSEQYAPPIGVVRLVIDRAVDVKNVEAALGGKSDPYVRVQVRNVTKGRTEVINNNLNPVWEQIIYIPVHSLRENMILECMDYQNLTRDRSLGSTELRVADLATESQDEKYPFQSSGVVSYNAPLRLDKDGVHKGTLQYTAEFVPSLNVEFHKFEDSQREISHDNGSDAGGDVSPVEDDDHHDGPIAITIKSEPKKVEQKPAGTNGTAPKGADTASIKSAKESLLEPNGEGAQSNSNGKRNSVGSVNTNGNGVGEPGQNKQGLVLSTEELLRHQSGIIVFHAISGHLAKKARLEVLLDDGYWPAFTTQKARSHHAQWGYVGEGFVKEVDFGRVWLRLNEKDDSEKEDIIGEFKEDAKTFLQATLSGPRTYTLKDVNDRYTSTVTIEARYIPVPVKLDAKESVNNQGILRVELIDGREIRGVDRSGKSDPFAVFQLNGQKVYKSQTKKKTIAPEWNESFDVTIPSRAAADFSLELFDWNQIEQAKSLGVGAIDVASLEPFEAQERTINLSSHKHGDKGQVRIRMVFRPEIIAKQRKNTSTFSTAGRAMTQIGGLPLSAGKGVFHGVTSVFKRGDKEEDDIMVLTESAPVADQLSQPSGAIGDNATAVLPAVANESTSSEPGTLRVTVMDAKDLIHSDVKPYATIRVGDKEHKTKHTGKTGSPEWNESFVFAASSFTPKLFIWVHDHKTLGKDKELGEGEVDIWRHVQTNGISSAEVVVQLRPGGMMRLRLEFDSESNPNSSSNSVHSGHHMGRTMSITPSRFSIRGHRPHESDDS